MLGTVELYPQARFIKRRRLVLRGPVACLRPPQLVGSTSTDVDALVPLPIKQGPKGERKVLGTRVLGELCHQAQTWDGSSTHLRGESTCWEQRPKEEPTD